MNGAVIMIYESKAYLTYFLLIVTVLLGHYTKEMLFSAH